MSLALTVPKGYKLNSKGKLVRRKKISILRILTSKGLDTDYDGLYGLLPKGVCGIIGEIIVAMRNDKAHQSWLEDDAWGKRTTNRSFVSFGRRPRVGDVFPMSFDEFPAATRSRTGGYGCWVRSDESKGIRQYYSTLFYKITKQSATMTTATRLMIEPTDETHPEHPKAKAAKIVGWADYASSKLTEMLTEEEFNKYGSFISNDEHGFNLPKEHGVPTLQRHLTFIAKRGDGTRPEDYDDVPTEFKMLETSFPHYHSYKETMKEHNRRVGIYETLKWRHKSAKTGRDVGRTIYPFARKIDVGDFVSIH